MSSTSISTAVDGGATPIASVHPDIIQSHILNRLDGPTLAATSCASAQLLSLCGDDCLWRDICNSTWPSTVDRRVRAAISAFPSGHRSFYYDAFPALRRHSSTETHPRRRRSNFSDTPELISAVDIRCDGELIYSKVLVTETVSTWFLCTPLRLDLLDPKETVVAGGSARAAERLRLSWILIDPAAGRAVNAASRAAVASSRHWMTGDTELRFSVVAAAGGGGGMVELAVVVRLRGVEGGGQAARGGGMVELAVVVRLRGVEGGGQAARVREVSMQVEDMAGRVLTGMDSLVILQAAMVEERVSSDSGEERDAYEAFQMMKARCRERKLRREKGLDTACMAAGISIFLAFLIFFFF